MDKEEIQFEIELIDEELDRLKRDGYWKNLKKIVTLTKQRINLTKKLDAKN